MLNGHRSRRALPAALAAGAVCLAIVLIPGSSQADPPPTLSQVRTQVHDLREQAEMAAERANEYRDQVKDIRTQLSAITVDVARQQKAVDERRAQVGQFAAAQYRTGGIDTTTQLFLAKAPDDFLARLSTTESVNQQQAGSMALLASEQKQLDEKKAAEKAELARLSEAKQASDAKYMEADAKLREGKALLARLTERERQRLAALDAAQERRQATATRATRDAQRPAAPQTDSQPADPPPDPAPVPASGRGAVALNFAKAQLGKPYVFGAAGPNAYDCSGLTMAAWAAAGVSLPHSSRNQYYSVSNKVSSSDLRPGDLVIFYPTMHHVAIYAGNGMVIHAPHTGSVVKYEQMSYMPFVGAVRPG